MDDFLAARGLQRKISVHSQSYMAAAAIVSHTDHLFILPKKVAAMMAGYWPLKMVALPEELPAITSTASGIRCRTATRRCCGCAA
jgi:hypothetical protein